MKAKKLTANQVKKLVNDVKAIYRLNGFVTGKRTNLQKATKECRLDYAELGKGINTSFSYPESVFEKEYQIDAKAHFGNNGICYEIWFEDNKCYLFQMYETKYLIVSGLGFCNVYRLIEKTESEKFEDQPAITNNGDSKETSISYEGKTINIKCLLSNTKVCKWDNKYPENHNHYIVTVSYDGRKLSFDWFDSFYNFRVGNIDKSRKEIINIFFNYLLNIVYKNNYVDKTDFCEQEGHTAKIWNTLCAQESNFNRVFEGVDIYELENNLQETFEF